MALPPCRSPTPRRPRARPYRAIGARIWYKNRSVPLYVTYKVTAPYVTSYDDKGISTILPVLIAFSESAASIAHMDKPIVTGVSLSSKVPGECFLGSDALLFRVIRSNVPHTAVAMEDTLDLDIFSPIRYDLSGMLPFAHEPLRSEPPK